MKVMQVRAAHVPQLNAFEIGPDALVRVEIGCVARQLLQLEPFGSALSQEVFDRLTAMDRRPIPEHQELAGQVSQEVAQEQHHIWTAEGVILDLQQQAPSRRDAADDRQMVARQREAQRWWVAAWGEAPHHRWQEIEARLIDPDDGAALTYRPLFSAGQRSDHHCLIAPSLRWVARRKGFCGVQPAARKRLPT